MRKEIIDKKADELTEMTNPIMEWDTSNIPEGQVDIEWECLIDFLTEVMKKKNYRNYYKDKWIVEVNGFGWRNLDGHKKVTAETGEELLREILPRCECTFKIFNDGCTGLKVQNFHHDSPTGNEWYYIRPMRIDEVGNDL